MAKSVGDRLLIGKHYSMERFGIMAGMSLILVFGLVFWGAFNTYRNERNRDLYQVIYEGNFSTSATGATGSVLNVYEDDERNDAAILMRFTDMSSLSNLAEDYSMHVYGMKDETHLGKIETPITNASYTIYGNTGYVVVTVHSDAPFSRELVQFMIGENNEKIPESRRTGNEALGDVYDIWYCILNLGGDGVYRTDAFAEDGTFDSAMFFQETIIASSENAIRADLDTDLQAISEALDNISAAERRAVSDNVDVDASRPVWVEGDTVTTNADGKLVFSTSTVALGGFDFDWRSGSVNRGYVADLAYTAGFDDVTEYLDTQIATQQPWTYEPQQWKLTSGEIVVTDEDANVASSMADARSDVMALDKAYTAYAAAKSKYQIDDLTSLLQLEVDAHDRSSVFKTNTESFLSGVE